MTLKIIAQNADGFKISPNELKSLLSDNSMAFDGDFDLVMEEPDVENFITIEPTEEVLEEGPDDMVMIEPLEQSHEFDLKLDNIPGAEDQDEIELQEEEVIEDPWQWKHSNIFEWCENRKENIPKHSGHDIVGLERAISYMKKWLNELSKVAQTDHDGIVDIKKLEDVRNELLNGIERCEDRLDKLNKIKSKKGKKKKADEEYGLVKEATKTGRFSVTVDLFISSLARICINSQVSAGHDLAQTFVKLAKEYNLDKREKLQVIQLLSDMGWNTYIDRGLIEKELDITSPNNFDWMANYPS